MNKVSRNNLNLTALNPTERLFIERLLIQLYPRLQRQDLIPWKWFCSPLIPDFLVRQTNPYCRRIVEIGCGDGVFSNLLALLFPETEIIGIDSNRDHILAARATVGQRNNLKFICANASVLSDIPCDRIIYNNCLSQLGNLYEFKKLVVKTSRWLVEDGDWIWKQSPWACLPYLKTLWPNLTRQKGLKGVFNQILEEIGYINTPVYQSQGLAGVPTCIYYHASHVSANIASNIVLNRENGVIQQENKHKIHAERGIQPYNTIIQEWQDWGDQSNDSLVNFLFSNGQAADFGLELI